MELKNKSPHRPDNLIIDVAEDVAEEILKTGEFIKSTKEKLIVEKKKPIVEKDKEVEEKLIS